MADYIGDSSNELLVGMNTDDTLDGGAGNDTLQGGRGSDTYIFDIGDGQDQVEDNGSFSTDVIRFTGYALADATFDRIAPGDINDLVISFANGDRVTVIGALNGSSTDGIEQYEFTDQTVTAADIRALIVASETTAGDDTLLGFRQADTIIGGTGDDSLSGGNGSDTYVFSSGDGADTIRDDGFFNDDRVEFTDYQSTDVTVSRLVPGGDTDVLLDFGNGDSVTIFGSLNGSTANNIEEFAFADGVLWSPGDLRAQILADESSNGDDTITGFDAGDTITGGLGDDSLSGMGGSDTYIYAAGDGADTIQDAGFFKSDRVEFTNYNSTAVTVSRLTPDSDADVVLDFGNGDSVTIINGLNGSANDNIEEFGFADGVEWTPTDLRAQILASEATSGNDSITGFRAGDTIEGGTGDDTLVGGLGSDIYIFNVGDGEDLVTDNGFFESDELRFTGYALADATVSRLGLTGVIFDFGNGDVVTASGGVDGGNASIIERYQFTDQLLLAADVRALLVAQDTTDGDDTIEGYSYSDTLTGGSGSDLLIGKGSDDTYIYRMGDGEDRIEEGGFFSQDRVQFVDYALADAAVSRDGNDLILTFPGGDVLTIYNTLSGSNVDTVEVYEFTDQTLSLDDIAALALGEQGTDGPDEINGFFTDDTLEGGLGNDVLKGGFGSDTYLFTAGDGQDYIEEDDGFALTATDRLIISGYSLSDLDVDRGTTGDPENLVLNLPDEDRIVIFRGMRAETKWEVEEVVLDDATLTSADVRALWLASERSGFVDGFENSNDVIDLDPTVEFSVAGGREVYRAAGLSGSDTYIYQAGDGALHIRDLGDGDTDRVVFRDHLYSDIDFEIFSPDNVRPSWSNFVDGSPDYGWWGLGGEDGVFIIDPYGETVENGIEEYEFADGSVLTAEDMRVLRIAESLTDGDDNFTGFDTDDTMEGGLGDDTLTDFGGDDTYVYRRGDGSDLYMDADGTDRIEFPDIPSTEVFFSRVSIDDPQSLRITLPDGGEIIIRGGVEAIGTLNEPIESFVFSDQTLTLGEIIPNLTSLVAQDDNIAGTEGSVTNGNLFLDNGNGADFDSEGDALTVTMFDGQMVDADTGATRLLYGGPSSISVMPNGDWTVDLSEGVEFLSDISAIPLTLEYEITEAGEGFTATADIALILNGINTAPEVRDLAFGTQEGVPLLISTDEITASATDPDDSDLMASIEVGPSNGTLVVLDGGQWRYTPNPEFFGTDSFTYSVSDDSDASDVGTATVTVEEFIEGYDLVVSDAALISGQAGRETTLTYALGNIGEITALGLSETEIWLSEDGVLSDDDLLIDIHRPFINIAPDTDVSYSFDTELPEDVGGYSLILRATGIIDQPEQIDRLPNNIDVGDMPVLVIPDYVATATVLADEYYLGQRIEVTGFTRDSESLETISSRLVEIAFENAEGETATAYALSDTQGVFFAQIRLDAGDWEVTAHSVGFPEEDTIAEDSFSVTGIAFLDAPQMPSAIPGETLNLSFDLGAFGASFTGADLTFDGDTGDWVTDYSVTPVLMDGGMGQLSLTLDVPADANGAEDLYFRVVTAEGAEAELDLSIDVAPPTPEISAVPNPLFGAMVRGDVTYFTYEIQNTGGVATSELDVILPAAFDWLDLVTPDLIDPLDPGEMATIILSASPDADIPIGFYDAAILVRGEIASELLDLQLRTIDGGEATLTIRVEDEATYFDAEGGFPLVQDARVQLIDALTREIVYDNEDVDGEVTITDLTPGFYELRTIADGHTSTAQTIQLVSGEATTVDSFISQQNVSYTWSVTETTIEDEYSIELTADFETRVPAPVVTLDRSSYDLSELKEAGDEMTIIVKATNHGLIQAEDVTLVLPDFENYAFNFINNPLHTDLSFAGGNQPAQKIDILGSGEETYFAYTVRLISVPDEDDDTDDTGSGSIMPMPQMAGGNPCVPDDFQGRLIYEYDCGANQVSKSGGTLHNNYIAGETEDCPADGTAIPGGRPGAGGNIFVSNTVEYSCTPLCPDQPNLPLCVPLFPGSATLACSVGFAQTTWNTVFDGNGGVVPDSEDAQAIAQNYLLTALGCIPVLGDVICAGQWAGWLICAALGKASGPLNLSLANGDVPYDELNRFEQGLFLDGAIETLEPYAYATYTFIEEVTGDADTWLRLNRDGTGKSIDANDFAFVDTILTDWTEQFSAAGSLITQSEIDEFFDEPHPLKAAPGLAAIDRGMIERFASHWNANLVSRFEELGVDFIDGEGEVVDIAALLAAEDLPLALSGDASQDQFNDDAFEAIIEVLDPLANAADEYGYDEIDEFLVETSERTWDFLGEVNDGICAKIRVQISQSAVLTRQAFEAVLEIENGGTDALSDLLIDLKFSNAAGEEIDPALFTISAPILSGGLTATDGTGELAAEATGRAVFTIVPNADAAIDGATEYFVDGTLSYMEGVVPVEAPLLSTAITVEPQPSLVLDYFQSRDVFGDDPLTSLIEPSAPFTVAVRVSNEGAGTAQDLRITSAAPEIIENVSGLAIDFDILGAAINGQGVTPSLTAEFGNVAAGETAVASWYYRSDFAGRFSDFEASFSHVNALGDGQSSQIAEVNIHELIQEVVADRPSDDDQPDYLVTAVDDLLWLPDTIFYSDGGQDPVTTVVGTASAEITSEMLTTTLTANVEDGWSYIRSLDPAMGDLRLIDVMRSDGSSVASENWWRTDRTYFVQGAPEYEDLIHILDYRDGDETETYTLSFVPLDQIGGTNGRDQLFGDALDNVLLALRGDDLIAPGLGADRVTTGEGDDDVTGTAEELNGDVITDFAVGDQIILRGAVVGDGEVDLTSGSAILDIDTDANGESDTTITLSGDYSDEVFVIRPGETDTIIELAGVGTTLLSPAGERFITNDAGPNEVYGDSGDDFVLAGAGSDFLLGGAGADVLKGASGADMLSGGTGNDELTGGSGADMFFASVDDFDGFGVDTITDFMPGTDSLILDGVPDVTYTNFGSGVAISVGTGFVLLEGISEDDLQDGDVTSGSLPGLALAALSETHALTDVADRFVTTDPATNRVFALGGDDTVITSDGADLVDGGNGSDFILTGAGADVLIGGRGNDILSGGADADRFEFTAGATGFVTDTITDFEIGTDKVVLDGYETPTFVTLLGSAAARLSGSEFILFEGVSQETLETNISDVFEFL